MIFVSFVLQFLKLIFNFVPNDDLPSLFDGFIFLPQAWDHFYAAWFFSAFLHIIPLFYFPFGFFVRILPFLFFFLVILLSELLHILVNLILELIKFTLRNIVFRWFTIRASLAKWIALVAFLMFLFFKFPLIFLYSIDDLLDPFGGNFLIWFFLFVVLTVLWFLGRNYQSCLKSVWTELISVFSRLDTVILHCFQRNHFLLSLLSTQTLLIQQLDVVPETLSQHSTHIDPFLRSKRDVLFLYRTVVKPSWSLNRVAMRYASQHHGSSCRFFELCHSENTAIISKDISFIG